MIIQYNGIIFKLGLIIEEDISTFPVEIRTMICWNLVKHWFTMLLARNSLNINHKVAILEYSKLGISDRDELLRMALSDVFTVRDGKHNAYIETID